LLILKEQEKVLLEELKDWLPKTIFDAHVHCRPSNRPSQNLFNPAAKSPGETFSYFSWTEHQKIIAMLFPGFICKFIVFSFVFFPKEAENNIYVQKFAKKNDNVEPVFAATKKGKGNILSEIRKNISAGFKGIKIKIRKERKWKNGSTEILDHYPMEVFKLLDNLRSFAIIHLPENIYYNSDELIFLAKKYHSMAFIISHMGNNYLYQFGFDAAMNKLAFAPNIFFDTSMVTDEKVMASAISILGHRRILYGSDAPYSYLRGEFNYGKDKKILFDPEICFPWVDKERYQSYHEKIKNFTLVHINNMMAIKNALKNIRRNNSQIKADIFCQNLFSAKII